jgi:flagellar basal-body rod protein FlgC
MINNVFRASQLAASGLKANRNWMNIISNNVSNAHALDTGQKGPDGNYVPYARQVPVFQKVLSESFRRNKVNGDILNGVAVKGVASLKESVTKVYDPSHPAARLPGTKDAGYVYRPAISIPQELADMKVAASSYEANLTVMSTSMRMTQQALNLGRR